MEPDERYTTIGASVLALVIAAALVFVWLSRSGSGSDFRYYKILFEHQSLEGLQVGGDVNMRGVKVGRVDRYTIDRENINRVEVTIRVALKTPVSENTSAVVARNFLTGIARINLVTPGKPGPELTRVTAGERYPLIPEGTSDFDQIAESANRLALAGEKALTNVNALLTPANQKAFGETLASVRDIAGGLRDRLGTIDVAARSVQDSAAALQKATERISVAFERAAGQVEPLARQADTLLRESTAAAGDLRGLLAGGQTTLVQTQAAVREMAKAAATLEREIGALGQRTESAADTGVLELRATAQELRRSADQLSIAVERLADPRAALIGPNPQQLGPGEKAR